MTLVPRTPTASSEGSTVFPVTTIFKSSLGIEGQSPQDLGTCLGTATQGAPCYENVTAFVISDRTNSQSAVDITANLNRYWRFRKGYLIQARG